MSLLRGLLEEALGFLVSIAARKARTEHNQHWGGVIIIFTTASCEVFHSSYIRAMSIITKFYILLKDDM